MPKNSWLLDLFKPAIAIMCIVAIVIFFGRCTSTPFQQALAKIKSGDSYAFFPVGLTETEMKQFDALTIGADEQYSRYGDLALLATELPKFLTGVSSSDEQTIQKASHSILQLIHKVLKASGQETAWVVVRASMPSDTFKIPRWHMDGNYYQPFGENFPKFVIALKGPSTLFYQANSEDRKQVDAHNSFDDAVRAELAQLLDPKKIMSPQQGEGALFTVGTSESAVHSEPDIQESRLFLALVFGSQKQIEEMRDSRRLAKKLSA